METKKTGETEYGIYKKFYLVVLKVLSFISLVATGFSLFPTILNIAQGERDANFFLTWTIGLLSCYIFFSFLYIASKAIWIYIDKEEK